MSERGSRQHFSVQLLQLIDAVLVWLAFVVAAALRGPLRELIGLDGGGEGLEQMTWSVFLAVPLTPLFLEKFGHYDRLLSKSKGQSLNGLLRGVTLMAFVIGSVAVFGKFEGARRLILATGFVLAFLFLSLRMQATAKYLRRRAQDEGFLERVVLAGDREETESFLREVDSEVLSTWKVVEHYDLQEKSVEDLDSLLREQAVQRVVFLAGHAQFERVAQAVEACEIQGVEAWIGASFLRTQVARPSFDVVGGKPMLVFRSTPDLSWQLFAKKLVDWVGAFLILCLTFPLLVVAMVGIRLASPGAPVIFRQKRGGLYGKPFRIYKFRTMIPDAEAQLTDIKESHGNELDGPAFKLQSDPRVFPFGAFLRKYSIDELPQMINVLRGQMSLVGPRPLPVHEIAAIENSSHRRRLSMKPGITCLWQISGRSDITSFDEWMKLDLDYIDRWSIWEDARILLKTVPAVLFGKGAR
jgi:exopolysaccharide biosynthesis polyprenyl glycosylphosphotransferase